MANDNNAAGKKKHKGGWQTILQSDIDRFNTEKASKRGNTSYKTRQQRAQKMFLFIRTLWEKLNYRIEDPHNLRQVHVEALVNYWVSSGCSAATVANYLSILTLYCEWIGKSGMVRPMSYYAPDLKRVYAAERDKSFTGNGIDIESLLKRVSHEDIWVGAGLKATHAFGLRREEVVQLEPVLRDRGHYLEVFKGTKGGRTRVVQIDTEYKRAVLDELKELVLSKTGNPKAFLANPDKDLAQNLARFSYIMTKCGITRKASGVTGHGLRTEFAITELARDGIVATIRGGTGKLASKVETDLKYLRLSESMGHGRKSVITAYSGPLDKRRLKKKPK